MVEYTETEPGYYRIELTEEEMDEMYNVSDEQMREILQVSEEEFEELSKIF